MKCPVRVEATAPDDVNLVDSDGVVLAKLTWMSDLNHCRKQKELGMMMAERINSYESVKDFKPIVTDGFCEPKGLVSSVYGKSYVTKIDSYYRKVNNPWGRKGKPK